MFAVHPAISSVLDVVSWSAPSVEAIGIPVLWTDRHVQMNIPRYRLVNLHVSIS